jgi:predicted TIM-barrel fold metal-dependent hydrolase
MSGYDLPIWVHPEPNDKLDPDNGAFSWPFETSTAMLRLVMSGVFNDYPNIKFITHHCGAMVSFFEKRIKGALSRNPFGKANIKHPEEHFRKFYNDTAVYGSTGALMCGHAFFGADHLLFGTDAPLGPKFGCTGETIDSIERMSIPDGEKEKILFRNAINLLMLSY